MRRVVVTGMGLVTPLGIDVTSTWSNIVKGACGVREWTTMFQGKPIDVGTKVAATVNEEMMAAVAAERKCITNTKSQSPKFISYALCAAHEALTDAGLKELVDQEKVDTRRIGVAIGSGIGNSVEEVAEAYELVASKGVRRLSPYFVPRLLNNLAAGHVAIHFKLKGPNHAVSTACATGAHSIGDAYRFIMHGDADMMVAGGTESSMHALSFAGFSRLKALSTNFNDNPQQASRPFDKDRDGFVMGEGAGVVVLEEYEHAMKRGAPIYAEVRGYGLSGDAFHLTAPSEDGQGALQCMTNAIRNSGVKVEDIGYVNAHATSTPLGDAVESEAISRLFKESNIRPAVSSTKGHIGHLLGAAGAVEAIFTILSISKSMIPPTINLTETDIEPEVFNSLDFIRKEGVAKEVNVALSNSFGFGGTNASLLFSKVA